MSATGELGIATTPELDRTLRRAQAECALVVLDLRELEFTAWSGAQLILAASRRARQSGGRLVVVRGPAGLDRILDVLGATIEVEVVDRPPGRVPPPRSWTAAA